MKRTTELSKIKNGEQFTWGQVQKIHEVGEYTIVEYHPWEYDGPAALIGHPNFNELSYHGYIKGRCTSESWETLDHALAGLIARKHEGANTRAGRYFMKMITP